MNKDKNNNDNLNYLNNLYNAYTGILYNNPTLCYGGGKIIYEFDLPQLKELSSKYNIQNIALGNTEFEKGLSLMRYFAPRLKHNPFYDNTINCNSLDLLDFCFNTENGINCLNKSKILCEMLLSLNIKSRRVSIRPYSPYDMDNHVVCELFDTTFNKWIMLDMSTNSYFINKDFTPLSVKEIRNFMKNQLPVSVIFNNQSNISFDDLFIKNLQTNVYFAKNLFFFSYDEYSTFGIKGKSLFCLPEHFDLKKYFSQNLKFRLDFALKNNMDKNFISSIKNRYYNLLNDSLILICPD